MTFRLLVMMSAACFPRADYLGQAVAGIVSGYGDSAGPQVGDHGIGNAVGIIFFVSSGDVGIEFLNRGTEINGRHKKTLLSLLLQCMKK